MVFPGDQPLDDKSISESVTQQRNSVVAVYQTRDAAENAYQLLLDHGFNDDQVSLVARGTDAADEIPSQAAAEEGASGASKGALIGGVGGGTLGLLAGVGAIAIPGIGPLLAAGWLASALGGALVGAGAGGWIGSMASIGVPEDVANRYGEQLSQGYYLVIVRATEGQGTATAKNVLSETTADDLAIYDYEARTDEFPGGHGPDEKRTERDTLR